MTVQPRGKVWEAIRANGFNQRQFAQLVKTHEANVSRVVTGRLNLDRTEQIRWAKVLKCRVEDLFGEGTGCAA
jgi:transcriptional regulator